MLLHPALVHLPVAFALFAPGIGLGLWLIGRAWPETRRLWLVLVFFHVLQAAAIYGAMYSGEIARDAAELSDLRQAIETHEDWAERFFLASLGAIGLAAVGVKRPGAGPRLALVAWQALLLGLCVYVGYLGGSIAHR